MVRSTSLFRRRTIRQVKNTWLCTRIFVVNNCHCCWDYTREKAIFEGLPSLFGLCSGSCLMSIPVLRHRDLIAMRCLASRARPSSSCFPRTGITIGTKTSSNTNSPPSLQTAPDFVTVGPNSSCLMPSPSYQTQIINFVVNSSLLPRSWRLWLRDQPCRLSYQEFVMSIVGHRPHIPLDASALDPNSPNTRPATSLRARIGCTGSANTLIEQSSDGQPAVSTHVTMHPTVVF